MNNPALGRFTTKSLLLEVLWRVDTYHEHSVTPEEIEEAAGHLRSALNVMADRYLEHAPQEAED